MSITHVMCGEYKMMNTCGFSYDFRHVHGFSFDEYTLLHPHKLLYTYTCTIVFSRQNTLKYNIICILHCNAF